ncbi:glutamyl-tRNA reductase-like protein isoform 1 [Dorcoceras hygrometricum]|uniref:Glutamyl-tRNA reductase-like protein isoform 1 n=1 Tax=Dorcoceras hygrometricum TaxID=472368 RepID=A0A2Z6ZXG6_9LAMI|nr:glutamyl-tRNA reductase-like protein isoform 1 [Dorcoceras hygrometricum]
MGAALAHDAINGRSMRHPSAVHGAMMSRLRSRASRAIVACRPTGCATSLPLHRAWRGSARALCRTLCGGGRRPTSSRQRCDGYFSSSLSSGLSRAAHEVFGPDIRYLADFVRF